MRLTGTIPYRRRLSDSAIIVTKLLPPIGYSTLPPDSSLVGRTPAVSPEFLVSPRSSPLTHHHFIEINKVTNFDDTLRPVMRVPRVAMFQQLRRLEVEGPQEKQTRSFLQYGRPAGNVS